MTATMDQLDTTPVAARERSPDRHALARLARVRPAQRRAHPPDPREAARRHRAADHVRPAVRLRLRRCDQRRRRQLPRVPDRRHPRAEPGLRADGPGRVDLDRSERRGDRPVPLLADRSVGLSGRPLRVRDRRRDPGDHHPPHDRPASSDGGRTAIRCTSPRRSCS